MASKTITLSPQCRRFLAFCATYLVWIEGPTAGKPLVWEPWQIEIWNEIFSVDPATGKRKFSTAYIGLAKGNGKSTMAAALAIYLLVTANEAGFQLYCCAASRDQAKVVFLNARRMVEAAPLLLDFITVTRDALFIPSTGASFRVLSSDAPKTHGKRPSAVIVDELHAHENGELYEAMETAMVTASEPLMAVFSNAGTNERGDTKWAEVYRRGLEGTDAGMYFYAPHVPEDQLDNPAAWKMANPASWITRERLGELKSKMPAFVWARFHANRATRGLKEWLPKGAWDKLFGDNTLIDGETVVIGVDLARRYDSAAIVIVAPRDGKFVSVCETWAVWNDPAKPPPEVHHVIEDDDKIPFDMVFDRVRELCSKYNVVEIPYDPWRIPDAVSEALEAEGLPMVRFDQTLNRMAPASAGLFQAVVEQQIVHGGDELFTAQVQASVAKDYGSRGWRLDKDKARSFMDAAIALAMAIDRAREWQGVASDDTFLIRYS